MSYKKITIFHPKQLKMIRLIKKWIINTFGFSKSETNGSLILIGLVIAVAIIPRLLLNMQKTAEVSSDSDKAKLQEWYNSIKFSSAEDSRDIDNPELPAEVPLNLTAFDPNIISLDELVLMGIPKNVSRNIINYRNAGGSYHAKEDLKKIYGMEEHLFTSMEPYLLLPDQKPKITLTNKSSNVEETVPESDKELITIAINAATAEELTIIRGIGPTLSERIIKYRDLLGGFYSQDQLFEVYGLEVEVIDALIEKIVIDSLRPTININEVDLKSLSSHPYISYPLAKAIINYRTVHGPFEEKSGIKKIKIVSDSLYNKLSPYISVRP